MTDIDYFISHSSKDSAFAEWADSTLRSAGYTTIADLYDFASGDNFIVEMNRALERSKRVLLLWSAHTRGRFAVQLEWANALATYSNRVVPVLLDKTPKPGILQGSIHIDLSSTTKTSDAQAVLLQGLRGKERPSLALSFPRDSMAEPSSANLEERFLSPTTVNGTAALDGHFAPRARQTDFAAAIRGAGDVWMAAKGFEALLHQYEPLFVEVLNKGANLRFLMHDPKNAELMRIMAAMSYSNREPEMVGARLQRSLERLVLLRERYADAVEIKITDWILPNGYTMLNPLTGSAHCYVEFFGYRLGLSERMAMQVGRETSPLLYGFHLKSYRTQWTNAKDVQNG